jgi:hypothetical protein
MFFYKNFIGARYFDQLKLPRAFIKDITPITPWTGFEPAAPD